MMRISSRSGAPPETPINGASPNKQFTSAYLNRRMRSNRNFTAGIRHLLSAAGAWFFLSSATALASTAGSESKPPDPPGTECYDLKKLQPHIEAFERRKPCLKNYCSAIRTQEKCNTESNYLKGCAWCGGSCKSFKAVHQAFISCVRSAYADHEPELVNGKRIPGEVSMSKQEYLFRGSAGAATQSDSVPDDLKNGYRWDISEVSRPGGKRVPIHMHPSAGLIKILEGEDISVFVEGEKDLVGLKKGDFYAMPANRKMATHAGCPTGYKDLDIFKTNICYPTWVVLEPAGYSIQDRQFRIDTDKNCE